MACQCVALADLASSIKSSWVLAIGQPDFHIGPLRRLATEENNKGDSGAVTASEQADVRQLRGIKQVGRVLLTSAAATAR
jgi:hypothetical protein